MCDDVLYLANMVEKMHPLMGFHLEYYGVAMGNIIYSCSGPFTIKDLKGVNFLETREVFGSLPIGSDSSNVVGWFNKVGVVLW